MKRLFMYLLAVLCAVTFLVGCAKETSNDSLDEYLQVASSQSQKEKEAFEKELKAIESEAEKLFYYQQLDTEMERRVYLQFVNGLQKRQYSIEIDSVSEEIYTRVYFSVAHDYPEFYWLTEEEAMANGIDVLDLKEPTYPGDLSSVRNALEERANSILAQAPTGSEYEKVKYFYEVIIQQTEYDVEALNNDNITWRSQGITSVLLDQKSVCAGYSRTFQYLCKKAGIDCIYVTGVAKDGQGGEFGHAWNLVKINGQYYGVDTTWGDPVFDQAVGGEATADVSYDYLCVTDEMLGRSRVVDKDLLAYWGSDYYYQPRELAYPVCADNSLNYYAQKGAYFAGYDEAAVLQYITDQMAQGNTKISLQFATAEALQQMVALVTTENNAVFYALGDVQSYLYAYDEQTYTFELSDWY